MPSNKTISIIIICGAIVLSTWLIFKKSSSNTTTLNNENVLVSNYETNSETNDTWKSLLSTISSDKNKILDTTASTEFAPEDTTLTAQMSKDVLSTYLLAVKGGQPFTPANIEQLVNNVLSSPIYENSGGAVYIASNLKIINQNDGATKLKYKNDFNKALAARITEIQYSDDPMKILDEAIAKDDEAVLAKIDPIIKSSRSFIGDLLSMNVPSDAVKVHLGVLNAMSNLLEDIEGIRESFSDPAKGLNAIGRYQEDIFTFSTSLKNISVYFEK